MLAQVRSTWLLLLLLTLPSLLGQCPALPMFTL